MLRTLGADGVVEGQGPVDDASLDLTAAIHLRDDGGVDGAGHFLLVDLLHRGEKRHLGRFDAERPGGPHGIGDDVDFRVYVGRDR